MANDRLWLRCTECGSEKLFWKHYPEAGYIWKPGELEAWMKNHTEFHGGAGHIVMYSENAMGTYGKKCEVKEHQ